MRKDRTLLPKKREAFAAISRFMTEGDIQLRDEEQVILNRWIYVDKLLRCKEYSEDEIIGKVVEDYKVSIYTAKNDINYTQRLFADARKIIKKYLIHLHLERIDKDIELLRKRLFTKQKDENGKEMDHYVDPKELAALAKLEEVYTYTLNSIPDEHVTDKQPPPIFQFILAPGQVIDRPMELAAALEEADKFIDMKQNGNGVYVAEEG